MFHLKDGRNQLFQWDLYVKLVVEDATVNQVHFCNRTDDCSLVCEVKDEEGSRVVEIPNILLQTDWPIKVYAYCYDNDNRYTKHEEVFEVIKRSKPADYVYTETEVLSYEALENRIAALEEGGGGSGGGASSESVILTREGALDILLTLMGKTNWVYSTSAADFMNNLKNKGLAIHSSMTIVYPYSHGFNQLCKFNPTTGTVSTTPITSISAVTIQGSCYYIALGNALYEVGTGATLKALIAKQLGVNLNNYYTKSQVDSLIQNSQVDVPNWHFVDDTELWLIDNDSALYKISGLWYDEDDNIYFASYSIDLPVLLTEIADMVIDYPVPVTYKTATMNENTKLTIRIEEGQARLYKDGEPATEFEPMGYYYWGGLIDVLSEF